MDPYNKVVIVRAVSSNLIYSLDPTTLADRHTPLSNNCNQIEGVMAYSIPPGEPASGKQYAGYLNCDGGGLVSTWSIRGGDLNNPDQSGTACTDFCYFDIARTGSPNNVGISPDCTQQSAADFRTGTLSLGNIATLPISWANSENPPTNAPRRAYLGFAFDDAATGNVGVWMINELNNNNDLECMAVANYSSNTEGRQLCSWRDTTNGFDYVAASGTNSPTSAWKITTDTRAGGNIQMSQVANLGAPLNKLIGIACTLDDALTIDATGGVSRIHLVAGGIGTVLWGPNAGYSAGSRAIAFSQNGRWGAYYSGATTVSVVNATNGVIVATLTPPTGTLRDMFIDDTGQNIYVATSTTAARFDVHTTTTSAVVQPGQQGNLCRKADGTYGPCGGAAATTSSGPAGSFFGAQPSNFDISGAGSATSGGFLMSLLIILGMASVGSGIIPGKATDSGRIWGAAVGALLGFGWTVFLNFMPPIITFLLVVVSVLLLGGRWVAGRKSGAAGAE